MKLIESVILGGTLILVSAAQAFAHPAHDPNMGHLKFAEGKIHAHLHWLTPPPSNEAKLRLEWHDGATHANLDPHGVTTVEVASGKTVSEAKVTVLKGEVGVIDVSAIHLPKLTPDSEVRVTLKQGNLPPETEVWKFESSKKD